MCYVRAGGLCPNRGAGAGMTMPGSAHSGTHASLSAGLLGAGFLSYVGGVLIGDPSGIAAEITSLFILAYLALNMTAASGIVKMFFAVTVVIVVAGVWYGRLDAATIARGADRLAFLSCLLLALIFLRLVAARDPAFSLAGAFLANQPPSRRYLSLGVGGNIFGVLLNLGGLGLLIEMTLSGQRRNEQSHAVSAQVHQIRERRIVSAIVRGFATIAFWSPFGIALNTLLLIFPNVHWRDFAPWGLGFAGLFLATGAVLDVAERALFPVRPRPVPAPPIPGQGRGMLMVVVHLCALAAIVLTLDHFLPLSFQSVLVVIVPLYAVIWIFRLAGPSGPRLLRGDFVDNAPRYVNEVGVFALAGLIGALLVDLVPRDTLAPVLSWVLAAGGPTALALALMWATILAAMIGLHPIITVAILGEFMLRAHVLPDRAVVLALLAGWTCTVCLAPLATTATYVGAIIGRSPLTVTWRWNGIFGLVIVIVLSLSLIAALRSGWL